MGSDLALVRDGETDMERDNFHRHRRSSGVLAIAALEIACLTARSVPAACERRMCSRRRCSPSPRRAARISARADRLDFTDTRHAFAAGELRHVSLADEPARIVLDYPETQRLSARGDVDLAQSSRRNSRSPNCSPPGTPARRRIPA